MRRAYRDILEAKRRAEFNMTEPQILTKLVEEAKHKGETIRKELRNLSRVSEGISQIMKDRGMLFAASSLSQVELKYRRCVGIDGSFQLVGGIGGKWYAPISVARIVIEDGMDSRPVTDIFWVGIEEIEVQDEHQRNMIATTMMLAIETKAILNWAVSNKPAYVMIDGPVVDPPYLGPYGEEYIVDRCNAIKKTLANCTLLGCVKKSRDSFYKEFLKSLDEKNMRGIDLFPTDQHLMAYVFSKLRKEGNTGPLFTSWIPITGVEPYETYKKHGVYVITLFSQKSISSPVLRIDIPLQDPPAQITDLDRVILQIVKAVDVWTYPGQDYPLPVYLAHEKSNIREGCAEVLYSEIMTRAHTAELEDQIILNQLR